MVRNNELVLTPPEPKAQTPMDLMSIALQNNAAIDIIERLAALQEKSLARDAEMQFNEAMNAAQAELGRVAPDLTNPQTHSRYASYAALDRKIRPVYTKHGFSLSFDSGDSPVADTVRVVCYVSHRGGHTRKYTGPPMPAEGKGAKGGAVMSPIHATGSAMSYGRRYLLIYIFNLAIADLDDDGNAAGKADDNWLEAQIEEIGRCETLEGLQEAYTTAANVALSDIKDINAYHAIKKAKETRKKELGK